MTSKYMRGLITNVEILQHFAENKEAYQYGLDKKLSVSYRTILRNLHDLEKHKLLKIVRKEPSKKQGKPKNVWAITFYGLMEVLKYMNNKTIDVIAQKYSDKWLIFAEWLYLKKKGGKWLYELVRGVSLSFNSLQTNVLPKFTEREIKQMGFTLKQREKHENKMRSFILENTKQECTDKILGLDSLFGSRENLLVRFLLNTPEEWMLHESARRTCNLFVDNPRIREYIDKRFEQEKTMYKLVDTIKIQWEKVKSKEAA